MAFYVLFYFPVLTLFHQVSNIQVLLFLIPCFSQKFPILYLHFSQLSLNLTPKWLVITSLLLKANRYFQSSFFPGISKAKISLMVQEFLIHDSFTLAYLTPYHHFPSGLIGDSQRPMESWKRGKSALPVHGPCTSSSSCPRVCTDGTVCGSPLSPLRKCTATSMISLPPTYYHHAKVPE